jgi:hypothetical protein
MKIRIMSFFLAFLFLCGTALESASPGSPDILNYKNIMTEKQRKQIEKRYGENLRGVEEFKDILLLEYLRNYPLYKINVFNPASYLAGRAIHPYSAALVKDDLVFLEDEMAVQAFIRTNVSRKGLTREKALDLAYVYALLRRFDVIRSGEDYRKRYSVRDLNQKELMIKSPCVNKEEGKYLVTLFVMSDPVIHAFIRIDVVVSPAEFLVTETFMGSRGGYD